MATYARRFVAAGVRLVGGCCGTTPEHTRQIAQAVRSAAPGARPALEVRVSSPAAPIAPVDRAEKSGLAQRLANREFAVVVEIAPPRGLNLSATTDQARRFRDLGAVAVNVPDYPRSGARATALALAAVVEQAGVETLLHYTCRDRTLVGLQSELVGAHAMGIRNLLVTTGSPVQSGNHANASPAVEVDAVGLMQLVTQLNHGLDVSGQPLEATTRFHTGVAVNLFPTDPDAEWRRLMRKIGAGAEFLMTPPVLDVDACAPGLNRLRSTGLPVLCGVAMLEGARHAEFLSSEVVGVRAADTLLERLRAARDQAAEAAAVTAEILASLRERCDGFVFAWLHGSPATAERGLAALRGAHRG